jgi:hypothetical protein
MVIRFYCIHQSYKNKIASIRNLSSIHPFQEANGVSQIASHEKSSFLLHAWRLLFIQMPQNGAIGVIKLTPKHQS